MQSHFTTTWLPNTLFALAALTIVGGVLGINTETNGDRLQAVGMGVLLVGISLVLRTSAAVALSAPRELASHAICGGLRCAPGRRPL